MMTLEATISWDDLACSRLWRIAQYCLATFVRYLIVDDASDNLTCWHDGGVHAHGSYSEMLFNSLMGILKMGQPHTSS